MPTLTSLHPSRSFSSLIVTFLVLLTTGLLISCSDSGNRENTTQSQAMPGENSSEVPMGRLPQTTVPLHYRLRLSIDPRRDSFSGRTRIQVEIREATEQLWLHGNQLQVNDVSVQLTGGKTINGQYQQVADIGVAQVTFPQALPAGKATLVFDYTAPFNTNLEGLYKVTTGNRDYAFTQFEATSARLAFPSFDEPAFKTPFDITLEVDPDHRAVTATPVAEREMLENGNQLLRFKTTPPLPTYLIAFAVGPLDERMAEPIATSDLRDHVIPLKGYAAKNKGNQLSFGLENTAAIVTNQEDYFGQPYPFAKLALIAVPDFGAGAMENVGAITYREQYLLQSPDTPVALRQRFLMVHAHELAHQWFGNLVTPEWWDDIWLNEAFATWMAAKTMHQLDPDGGYQQRMLNSALETMALDRLASARQIRQPVTTHEDIGAAFDGITYQKGGAVLSMLEAFVGEEAFKQGVQTYMATHKFDNATARDFVRAIASARPDLPEGQVEKAFFSFLEQPGTPLVGFNWHCQDGTTRVDVEQSRYLPLGSRGERDRQWLLPLCVSYEQNGKRRRHCELIDKADSSFQLDTQSCPAYVMPNANADGYYRFALNDAQWQSLLTADTLNERERMATANSLSAAFHAGRLTPDAYLKLLDPLLNTDSVQTQMAPLDDIYLMDEYILSDPDRHRAFADLVDQLYRPIYERVALEKDLQDPDLIRLRNAMLRLYSRLIEDQSVRETLHQRATRYVGFEADRSLHPEALDTNIRQEALRTAVTMEDREFADLLLEHFHNSSDAVLRQEILRALAASQNAELIAHLRELALSDRIRDNEVEHIIEPLMGRPEQRDITWQWLRDNLDAVVDRIPSWFQGRVVSYGNTFCSEERAREIETELKEQIMPLGRGPRSLANTVEQIRLCEALVEEQGPKLRAILAP